MVEEPESVTYHELERLAPYIKEAGFVGYHDIEYSLIDKQDGDTFDSSIGVYTGVAMFNPEDIKGVYAAFDPDAVPEGESYGDDIMYSRRNDAVGRSARDMFSGTDRDMFNQETGEVDYSLKDASRKIVVDMPIDMFLHLAGDGYRSGSAELVRELAEAGTKFDMIPALYLTFEGEIVKTGEIDTCTTMMGDTAPVN